MGPGQWLNHMWNLPIRFAAIAATADGDNELVAAPTLAASGQIWVFNYVFTVDTAGQIILKSSGGTVHATYNLAANGGISFAGSLLSPAFICDAGEALELTNPAGVDTHGHLSYVVITSI